MDYIVGKSFTFCSLLFLPPYCASLSVFACESAWFAGGHGFLPWLLHSGSLHTCISFLINRLKSIQFSMLVFARSSVYLQ